MSEAVSGGMPKNRIEAFSDGVIAIIITLLILEIKIPEVSPNLNDQQLLIEIYALLPKFTAYIVSFILLMVWWTAHHQFFHALKHATRNLLWLNNFFLMWLCIVPLPTALLGEYPDSKIAACFYGIISTCATLSFFWMRYYASFRAKLFRPEISESLIKAGFKRGLIPPITNIAATFIALYSPHVAIAIFVITAVYFMFPSRLDRIKTNHHE